MEAQRCGERRKQSSTHSSAKKAKGSLSSRTAYEQPASVTSAEHDTAHEAVIKRLHSWTWSNGVVDTLLSVNPRLEHRCGSYAR